MDAIVFLTGSQRGQRSRIARPVTRLGRERKNDIYIDDDAASRRHAEIFEDDGTICLRDLDSTNGTYLNDRRILQPTPLTHGDKLTIGDITMLYLSTTRRVPETGFALIADSGRGVATAKTLIMTDDALSVRRPDADENTIHHFDRLSAFTADVSNLLNMRRLLDVVMEHVFASIKADRGQLMLIGKTGDLETEVKHVRDTAVEAKDVGVSRTLLQEVVEGGESVLASEPKEDQRFADTEAVRRDQVSSLICSPLKVRDKVLGVLYVDTVGTSPPLGEADLQLLTAMAIQASVCIENARLYEQLMDAVEHNESIIRSLSSGLMVCDQDGSIRTINEAAAKQFKMTTTELIGRKLSDFHHLKALARLVQETMQQGIGLDQRDIEITVENEWIPLGASTSVLEDREGQVVGVVLNFRSLAQLRAMREEVRMSQHLAAVGEMAAGVAHEIRNPLNSIRGFAQILAEKVVEEPLAEYLKIIIEEVDRMNQLVQDMLDFARPQPLSFHTVQINPLIKEVLAELLPDINGAEIQVELHQDDRLPPITGNRDKLKQVLLNVVTNAIQAMEETTAGEKRLTVTTELKPGDEQDSICISISDTGKGIPPHLLDKIFEPFFTRRDVGTGLGLSICRKIMEQHGGQIVPATPRPDEGATFDLTLPARPVMPSPAVTPPDSGPPRGAPTPEESE